MSEAELGEHLEAWITGFVASGRYATRGDVLREGLRLPEHRENSERSKLEVLRDLIREGDETGRGHCDFDASDLR